MLEKEPQSSGLSFLSIPRKGIHSEDARAERVVFLEEKLQCSLETTSKTVIAAEAVKNNVENFIGAVQIPVGVAGPLRVNRTNSSEHIYAPMATTEGALVASLVRGAKALTLSGGVTVRTLSQRMTRAPVFEFNHLDEALEFSRWVAEHEDSIAEKTREYSNFAELISVQAAFMGKTVHLKFAFKTGDAAGQNMTTTCTWNTCRWILAEFEAAKAVKPQAFYLEGNLSGDKKVTPLSAIEGRGTQVVAEALIKREILKSVLNTEPAELVQLYHRGQSARIHSGLQGFNINVANVVAGIFAATGQDLACVHESSVAQLHLELNGDDLYASLYMPSLVVGTVGGGVNLPTQREMLELMGCRGNGKSARLAENIAAFALALDLSTACAITSDEFADAHERLGRNRQNEWLKKAELSHGLFESIFSEQFKASVQVTRCCLIKDFKIGDSILVDAASRVTRRMCGIFPFEIDWRMGIEEPRTDRILVKVKATDEEVLVATELMAHMAGDEIGRLAKKFRAMSPFTGCHVRELKLAQWDDVRYTSIAPKVFGVRQDDKREVYLLAEELIDGAELMNSAADVSAWKREHVVAAIHGIAGFHGINYGITDTARWPWIGFVHDSKSMAEMSEYWRALARHSHEEWPHVFTAGDLKKAEILIQEVTSWWGELERLPRTIIHHDFNPRNMAFRRGVNGALQLCAYDWELATVHVPQRDLAELLAFTLNEGATIEEVGHYVEEHRIALEKSGGVKIPRGPWRLGYKLSLYDFMINRMAMYFVAHSQRHCPFLERTHRTLKHLIALEDHWGH